MTTEIQNQFPILGNSTYVNTPGSGILSKDVLEWRRQHDEDYFNAGSIFRKNQERFLQGVRQSLADFFNASVQHTFLVPNFSFGMNTFLEGLSRSERFLLLREDYPSVNYAIESRGFSIEYLQIDEYLEENIIAKIERFKPTVFAFSLVQYISGIKLNFDFIKQLKERYPSMLFVADGTQFCGATSFDFEASGLDFLGSSGYKWMLSGYGNGFVFLKEGAVNRLYADALRRSGPTEPFLKERGALSLYFEPGHLDTLVFGTLQQSILSFEKLGIDHIETFIKKLSKKAKEAFAERGLLAPSVVKREDHSSIYNLNLNGTTYEKLSAERVICLPRGGGIRVGFHLYNNEEDLEKLLAIIDRER